MALFVSIASAERLGVPASNRLISRISSSSRVSRWLSSWMIETKRVLSSSEMSSLMRISVNERMDVRFGVKNVTDKVYYDTAYRSGEPFTYVAPGREIWAAIDMKF